MADDTRPGGTGRRRFVEGVVGSATLASIGTAAVASTETATTDRGTGGGATTYFGVENVAGPAPRAMPQIPVEIDGDGYVRGQYPSESGSDAASGGGPSQDGTPAIEIGGVTYSPAWFQYCGVQEYEGLSPTYDGDDYFRHAGGTNYEWQERETEPGSRVHVDEFDDYETWGNGIGAAGVGKPAAVTWRSAGTDDVIPVLLLRSGRVRDLLDRAGSSDLARWLEASTDGDFVAVLGKCTHYCCVPGFKAGPYVPAEAADRIYCPCHQSEYDPFSIVRGTYRAYPRPGD